MTNMNKNQKQTDKQELTPKQKQAVVVCAICALAIVITASVTGVLVAGKIRAAGQNTPASSETTSGGYDPQAYQIDAANTAVLGQTADAGDAYLKDTLFVGDSNTLRFNRNGLLTLQQFCAKEGLGIQDAATEKFVTFKNDSSLYSIPDAVAKMKPRRVVITLGTNNGDGSMSTADFITAYKGLIGAIQSSYPYTDLIVNAIPPIPADHSSYPAMDQAVLDQFNMALAQMCQELNIKFLNSTEVLKGTDGYGKSDYYVSGDIHLKTSGLQQILSYVTSHAYESTDRRPETANIAVRSEEYAGNGTATAAPTSTPGQFAAKYQVDSAGGGTLTSGSETGKTSLSFEIKDRSTSITVKAVPNDGLMFIKWSDGVTTATRTDKDFKQNVNVTAIFAEVGIKLTGDATATVGRDYTLKASLINRNYGDLSKVIWYVKVNDGQYRKQGIPGASYTLTIAEGTSYSIYAVLLFNDTELKSNVVTIAAPTAAPSPSPSPTPNTPTPTPNVTPTPTPNVTPTPTPNVTPEPTPEPTSVPTEAPTPEPASPASSEADSGAQASEPPAGAGEQPGTEPPTGE